MEMNSKLVLLLALLVVFSCKSTEAVKLKATRIQFYMHDVVGGPNPTAVRVAGPDNSTGPNSTAAVFGSIYMMDNPLTVTPDPNSTVVGRAQGMYGMSSQNEFSLLMSLTVGFTSGTYNGSTFSMLGRNPIMNEVREMPVVGGTGIFRLARGYCLAKTHSAFGFDAIIGYNVTFKASSKPHLQDEEYIVFCFGEDGDFDVVKECKSETLECFDTSPSSVNPKLHSVEVSGTIRKNSHHQKSDIVNGLEKEITPVKKDGEEAGSLLGSEPPCNATTRSYQIGEIDNCGTVSAKSSDSKQSDGSTGSFSFPVMRWELIGSPVQMPKSESLYARKHKAPCARFQCCRF
ncbi:unnamed protein product [Dovyalis caffra]|uniref:Dirigent protein n=1 Tax=Dovyalis caffra TaxID=77055 RepID=A0AAV1QRR6_9ROSI|nr:unnamed protein product [Dovyalis caffra]